MNWGYVGSGKLSNLRKYKVTFRYHYNYPTMKRSFDDEVEAENRWDAEAKTAKKYPNVTDLKINPI